MVAPKMLSLARQGCGAFCPFSEMSSRVQRPQEHWAAGVCSRSSDFPADKGAEAREGGAVFEMSETPKSSYGEEDVHREALSGQGAVTPPASPEAES